MTHTFYRIVPALLFFTSSSMMLADQVSSPIRDELLRCAEREESALERNRAEIAEKMGLDPAMIGFTIMPQVTRETCPQYHAMVDTLVEKSGLATKPGLFLDVSSHEASVGIQMGKFNGNGKELPIIYITKKAVELFNDDEIEAAIALNIARLGLNHKDVEYWQTLNSGKNRLLTAAPMMLLWSCGVTAVITSLFPGEISPSKTSSRAAVSTIGAGVIGGWLIGKVVNKINTLRFRSFRRQQIGVDAFVVEITQNPHALINVLKKIDCRDANNRIAALEQIAAKSKYATSANMQENR